MRNLTRIVLASGEFGRPMMAGPGVPRDRIKTLRYAYGKALRDPSLIDETKKGQMDMEYTPGEELQAQIKELLNQPREVVDLVKKILAD
jgi:tripartite-type tricarboxylate transporter receptor subunit TctC